MFKIFFHIIVVGLNCLISKCCQCNVQMNILRSKYNGGHIDGINSRYPALCTFVCRCKKLSG